MTSLQRAVLDLKSLDLLANGNSGIHRLDARAKVLVTLNFILCIVSCNRYELSALIPFFIFPISMASRANIPVFFILRKIALLCPFVLAIALFNPIFDRTTLIQFGPLGISGGWMSLASIMIRSFLTVGAAFILIGVTGFATVCQALEQLGLPRVFTVQLMFLYRYIFVLTEEVYKTTQAFELRSCGKKLELQNFGSLAGHLLLRTWKHAERIHTAMVSRGFQGEFCSHKPSQFGVSEMMFVLGWTSLFIILRFLNIPRLIGTLVTGGNL
jgi:cobalt/nickel transport system permease protein